MRAIDIIGQRFGKWLVLSRDGLKNGSHAFKCKCDCGTIRAVSGSTLRAGISLSCGCVGNAKTSKRNFKHGLYRIPERGVWCQMIQRCENPKYDVYNYYGGRGIKVCKRWRKSFLSFIQDMGRRPSENHSIDRKDNNGDYEPGNCHWATKVEQSNNRRSNRFIEACGLTLTLKEWSVKNGIPESTIWCRLRSEWPTDKAVSFTRASK